MLCNSEDITLTLRVSTDTFNGMIYPKGLSKNSTCMTEYIQQEVDTIYIQCQQEKSIFLFAGLDHLCSATAFVQHNVNGR